MNTGIVIVKTVVGRPPLFAIEPEEVGDFRKKSEVCSKCTKLLCTQCPVYDSLVIKQNS